MEKIIISAQKNNFDEFLQIAKEHQSGLEVQAFAYPEVMDGDWKGLLEHYLKALEDFKNGIALHNAFIGLKPVSRELKLVALTRERYRFNIQIARELRAQIVIFHSHWSPFIRGKLLRPWQEGQVAFWSEFLKLTERDNFTLLLENTAESRPEILKWIIDQVGSPRFKFLFDVGHAHLFSEVPLADWVITFRNDLYYIHFHNNFRDFDAHNSVKQGTIDFDPLFAAIRQEQIDPYFCTEVLDTPSLLETLNYLHKQLSTDGQELP